MYCKDCNSQNIIEHRRGGCTVCADCGLVAEPFLIDHSPIFDSNRAIYQDSISYANISLKNALFRLNIDSSHLENQIALHLANQPNQTPLTQAQATYTIIRQHKLTRITLSNIASAFDVPFDKLFKTIKDLQPAAVTQNPSSIRERIHPLLNFFRPLLNPSSKSALLKELENIETNLKRHKEFKGLKPSKLDATILYYVLSKQPDPPKVKTFLEKSSLSICTLKKNLSLITKILA